jgi:hypothetical protein
MNNGYGTGVIFSTTGITQTMISGAVIDFKLARQAEIKEVADGANQFLGVSASKRKKVATLSVLLQTSGSTVTLPNILDTATFTNTWSGDCSGSWAVTGQPSIDWKQDDFAKASLEITQWVTATGTLP